MFIVNVTGFLLIIFYNAKNTKLCMFLSFSSWSLGEGVRPDNGGLADSVPEGCAVSDGSIRCLVSPRPHAGVHVASSAVLFTPSLSSMNPSSSGHMLLWPRGLVAPVIAPLGRWQGRALGMRVFLAFGHLSLSLLPWVSGAGQFPTTKGVHCWPGPQGIDGHTSTLERGWRVGCWGGYF